MGWFVVGEWRTIALSLIRQPSVLIARLFNRYGCETKLSFWPPSDPEPSGLSPPGHIA
jgi:hypothetical protein